MDLWSFWWSFVTPLKPAFKRQRSFLWFAVALAGASIRPDLNGVTSFVRALGLGTKSYLSLLAMCHSSAIDLKKLTTLWVATVISKLDTKLERSGGRQQYSTCDALMVASGAVIWHNNAL